MISFDLFFILSCRSERPQEDKDHTEASREKK